MALTALKEQDFYPLHTAARKGDLPEIKSLLSSGADVNERDDQGMTPLHEALTYDSMELLLKSGADVNAQDMYGSTPLKYLPATENMNVETVKLFLSFNANVNLRDSYGRTPLHNVFHFSTTSLEVVKLLVDHGLDVNSVDKDGWTLLHCAGTYYLEEIFKFLLKKGSNINATSRLIDDGSLYTPLTWLLKRSFVTEEELTYPLKYVDFGTWISKDVNIFSCCADTFCHCKFILKHIAKLQALSKPVHEIICNQILDLKDLQEYFRQCHEELEKAKNTKLKHCWVTFFNLLVDSKKKLRNYAGNEDLVADFIMSVVHLNKFPIYGQVLEENMERGIKARKLFDESAVILSDKLPILNSTHLIIRDILDCLTVKNYNMLVS